MRSRSLNTNNIHVAFGSLLSDSGRHVIIPWIKLERSFKRLVSEVDTPADHEAPYS